MERRKFIQAAGGAAAAAVATSATAEALPTLTWRMASSFPKSLDTLFGGAEFFAQRVSELTQGKFTIRAFPAGEIVPAFQVLDAVQNGTIEMGHTPLYIYFGKDPTFTFDTCGPFGMSSRQQTAWYTAGGGREIFMEFLKSYGITTLPCGNTGCQMGGWFRKEIKSLEDMAGLKMRVGGFGGRILQKLGVVPQQIAGGDIYPALEKGTIDAAEFTVPHDDEKLGLNKIAKFYYYPGWNEGGAALGFQVNAKAWDALPESYRAALQAATAEANTWMQAKYDALNPVALKRLVQGGAVLRAYPQAVLEACFKANNELMAETAAKSPAFKRIFDHMRAFQRDQIAWFRVAEAQFDGFMSRQKM